MATTHGKKGIIYKWNGVAGDLSDEPCTVTGNDAQITDSTKRILNPNVTVTFSQAVWAASTAYSLNDLRVPTSPNGFVYKVTTEGTSGSVEPTWPTTIGATVLDGTVEWTCDHLCRLVNIDYANGTAHFSGVPAPVTCSGTGAYVPTGNLVKTGYLYEWTLSVDLEVSEYNSFQSDWKNFMAGHASANGSAKGWFVGTNWWDDFEDNVDGTMDFFFLQLFTYDPDDDRTGDHFDCWVMFSGFELPVGMTGPVSETVSFQVLGYPPFTPNA